MCIIIGVKWNLKQVHVEKMHYPQKLSQTQNFHSLVRNCNYTSKLETDSVQMNKLFYLNDLHNTHNHVTILYEEYSFHINFI